MMTMTTIVLFIDAGLAMSHCGDYSYSPLHPIQSLHCTNK